MLGKEKLESSAGGITSRTKAAKLHHELIAAEPEETSIKFQFKRKRKRKSPKPKHVPGRDIFHGGKIKDLHRDLAATLIPKRKLPKSDQPKTHPRRKSQHLRRVSELVREQEKRVAKAAKSTEGKIRRVSFKYKEPQVSEDTRKRVWRYYRNNTTMHSLVQQVNGHASYSERISLADAYMILYDGIKLDQQERTVQGEHGEELKARHSHGRNRLSQRTKYLQFELRINEFVRIYNDWRHGMSQSNLIKKYPRCEVGLKRLIRSLNLKLTSTVTKPKLEVDEFAAEILQRAMIQNIEGRVALVVFVDELDPLHIQRIGILENVSSGNIDESNDDSAKHGNSSSDFSLYNNRKMTEHAVHPDEADRLGDLCPDFDGQGKSDKHSTGAFLHSTPAAPIRQEDELNKLLEAKKSEEDFLSSFPIPDNTEGIADATDTHQPASTPCDRPEDSDSVSDTPVSTKIRNLL